MSVDDILFAPLGVPGWLAECREIVDYISNRKHQPVRLKITNSHPAGALLLEELCRLYHEEKQDIFWLVFVPSDGLSKVQCREIFFDGRLVFDTSTWGFPQLATVSGGSIRDLNLVRNTYTDHYVFATRQEAHDYWKDVDV